MKKYFQQFFQPCKYMGLGMKLFISTSIFILALPVYNYSQHFISEWTVQSESGFWELASDFTIADSNNIFLAGNYYGNSTIKRADATHIESNNADSKNSGSIPADSIPAISNANQNMFVARFDQNGNAIWVNHYTAEGYVHISTIKSSGRAVYVAGYFKENLDFGEIKLKANHKGTAFVAKLDFSGKMYWAVQIAGDFVGQKLFVIPQENKNVIIAGSFANSICLKDTIAIANSFGINIFAVLLDSAGGITKSIASAGAGKSILTAAITDKQGNLYLGGSFDNTILIGNKAMQSIGKNDGYIFCFDKGFEPRYSKQIGSIYKDDLQGLAIDNMNNLIAIGGYSEEISTLGIKFPAIIGNMDVFIVKIDPFGNPVWVDGFGSSANDYATGIAASYSGKIFISGSSRGAIKKENFTTTANHAGSNLFIAKYSADGVLKLLDTLGVNRTNFNRKIEIDNEGYLIMSGNFHKTYMDEKGEIPKVNPDNFHLTKLFDCDSQKTIQIPSDTTICGTSISITVDSSFTTYNWNIGSKTNHITIDTTGAYILTVTDKFGCTSNDTIHVVVNQLPSFTLDNAIIIADGGAFTLYGPDNMREYLWNDGGTQQYIILPERTIYPVLVKLKVMDANGCQAESQSNIVKKGNILTVNTDLEAEFSVLIYPIPTKESFTVKVSNQDINSSLLFEMVSADGKSVIKRVEQPDQLNQKYVFDSTSLAEGVYLFHINNGFNSYVKQIMITK